MRKSSDRGPGRRLGVVESAADAFGRQVARGFVIGVIGAAVASGGGSFLGVVVAAVILR